MIFHLANSLLYVSLWCCLCQSFLHSSQTNFSFLPACLLYCHTQAVLIQHQHLHLGQYCCLFLPPIHFQSTCTTVLPCFRKIFKFAVFFLPSRVHQQHLLHYHCHHSIRNRSHLETAHAVPFIADPVIHAVVTFAFVYSIISQLIVIVCYFSVESLRNRIHTLR